MADQPIVTVKPEGGGWMCSCTRCPWERFDTARTIAERVASRHRAAHEKAGA